ncbi:MAG: hypothetical protein Ct9H300mP25_16740 [Acidobacteriota bacterium]|nr:MAG: hypothetical protein Ct9H300mP25_16740 [Acidobacteriota bacterium]
MRGGPTRIDSVVSEVHTSITVKGVERNVAALTRWSCQWIRLCVFLIVLGKADLTAQEIELPWVRVEAGTFQMGCVPDDPFCLDTELPRHEVTLSAFELMETELTVVNTVFILMRQGVRRHQPRFFTNW